MLITNADDRTAEPPGGRSARDQLVAYLRRQLIGPSGENDEVLADLPQARYLLGILFPQESQPDVFQEDEEIAPAASADRADEPIEVDVASANDWLPSSLGLSFFVVDASAITCNVWGARYVQEKIGRRKGWRRQSIREFEDPEMIRIECPNKCGGWVPRSPALDGRAELAALWRPMPEGFLVTVSLVNAARLPPGFIQDGKPSDHRLQAESCLHQVGIRCSPELGSIAEYPTVDAIDRDDEEQELRLIYRHAKVFAVGHGTAVTWPTTSADFAASVETESLPSVELPALTYNVPGHERLLRVRFLIDADVSELEGAMTRFIDDYATWVDGLALVEIPSRYEPARDRIIARQHETIARLRHGVDLLARDADALRAFRLANRAMLMQMYQTREVIRRKVHRRDAVPPACVTLDEFDESWRPFQLAFQLLTLSSIVDETSPDREIVDLIWFPTGGGKTEAYLAVAAFVIFFLRLRRGRRGAGTAVITRYTLSLLTAQQFQRAATLVCACELARAEDPATLGDVPISIGLWIGDRHTPNRLSKAFERYRELRDDDEPSNPFQLNQCPWCGTSIVPERRDDDELAYGIRCDEWNFEFFCPTRTCEFHDRLPVSVIDEDLYRNPPSFLLATVDKFAMLAWEEGSTAFFGSSEFEPPSLIIQDELHLLSGALGTIVGLYESAIETLIGLRGARPKIIASTATIRRSADQARGLFGRQQTQIFPAPGIDADDSFFARADKKKPGRRYVGIMPQSHSAQTSMVNVAASIAQSVNECDLSPEETDGYWTQVIYHNSLRELGQTVTLARDDIPERIRIRASDPTRERRITDDDIVELRSQVDSGDLPSLLQKLFIPMGEPGAASIVACTNMFSVGVDVPRLGLMLVNGQPKSTAEYIQSTSRVGRGAVPGLVVTLYRSTRPRDRSHYEQFVSYHNSLYKRVEPTSVTPFSPPSRARALHAALVILARHWIGWAADDQAGEFRATDPRVVKSVEALIARARETDPTEGDATSRHLERIVLEWDQRARETTERGRALYYRPAGKSHANLLKPFERVGPGWPTLQNMRNVDAACRVFVLGTEIHR